MSKKQKFNIEVGTSIISIFTRMETKTIQLFSEFVDNSLQSFIDNRETLSKKCGDSTCKIKIDWSNDEITILDNSFGMNEEEFGRALRLNAPAKIYSKNSLSKYGMGLKYAAASLGSWYSIESTQYGSNIKYYGVLDIEKIKKTNPKSLDCTLEDCDEKEHYTKITIKNLIRKFSIREQDKLVSLLGKVYDEFIDDKTLSISVNNIKVAFSEPEYRTDSNGKDYLTFFNNSFSFDGKEYEYSGYMGILKVGNSDEAGLQLKQNGRVIELNYKPKEIFGKGNDYRQQRIYGQITFLGDNWVVRFDKDGLAWDGTGVEETFIKNLKNDKNVSKLLKTAIELRKSDNPICKVTVKNTNANVYGLKANYGIGELVSFNVVPNIGYIIKNVKIDSEIAEPVEGHENSFTFKTNNPTVSIVVTTEPDKNYVAPEDPVIPEPVPGEIVNIDPEQPDVSQLSEKERIEQKFKRLEEIEYPCVYHSEGDLNEEGYIIKFKNETFSFEVAFINDTKFEGFIEIKEKQPFKNSYIICLNTSVPAYQDIRLSGTIREVLIINAITLSLARLMAANYGIKMIDSQKIIDAINTIL